MLPISCPLQAMNGCTGELVKACVSEQLSLPLWQSVLQQFPLGFGLFAADRASSNIRGEASFCEDVAADSMALRLSIPCNAHLVSLVQERSFAPIARVISGMIAFARALQLAGAADLFRQQLVVVLHGSVRAFESAPPPAPRRDHLLKLLLSGSAVDKARQIKLRALLTGDISKDAIEWHVAPGPDVDTLAWAQDVAELLFPSAPPVFQRHRWVNAWPSLSSCALLANVHNLLKRIVPRWVAVLRNAPVPVAEAGIWTEEEGDLDEDPSVIPRVPSGATDWTAYNEKQRGNSLAFAAAGLAPDMLTARVAMEPQIKLLHSIEGRASHKWFEDVLLGWIHGPPVELRTTTPCRISDAAEQRSTKEYCANLSKLALESDAWEVLPPHERSQRQSSLAFAMLSRALCAMDQLLSRPQSGFPYTLFRLLLPSCDVAAERQHIRNAPDCMLDEFSKRFLKVYPALDGDECFAVLTAVGLMQAHLSYYFCLCRSN